MGLTLTEKPLESSYNQGGQVCDLESSAAHAAEYDGTVEGDELALGQLLSAAALLAVIALLLWASARLLKSSLALLSSQPFFKGYRSRLWSAGGDTQGIAGPYDSPPTPPPVGWLRDADSATPSFVTPTTEPLLFSVSPSFGAMGMTPVLAGLPHSTRNGGAGYQGLTTASDQAFGLGETPGFATAGGGSGGGVRQRLTSGGGRATYHGSSGGAGTSCVRGGGWDPGLLAQQSAMLPAISSVDGLMADPAFQEYMRSTRGRTPALARGQSQAKVQLYKDLRRLDPDAFKRLMSRTDVKSYDVQRPPLALALVDYLVWAVAMPLAALALACGLAASGSLLVRYGPLVAWLLSRLWLAGRGHTSLLGRLTGLYLVYDIPGEDADGGQDYCALGNAWEHLAGLGGHLLLALFEPLMAAASCGLLVMASLASIMVGPSRQTLAMRLLGLRLEREVSRQTTLSPFTPVADTSTSSPVSSGYPYRHTSVRYGLTS